MDLEVQDVDLLDAAVHVVSLLEHALRAEDPLAESLLSRLLARTDYEQFCAMMHAEYRGTVRAALDYREHGDDDDEAEYAAVEVEAWADDELGEEEAEEEGKVR